MVSMSACATRSLWSRHGVALTLVCLSAWLSPAHAARLALVIGNDQYAHVAPLKNARNDARLMAATLKAAGYDVVDGPRENLSGKAMWRALDQFRARIAKGDEVVFFFAGHGVQIGGSPVLLPVDIEAENDMQVEREGVKLYDLQDYFRDAKFALLVIDACRDNPFPRKPGSSRTIGDTRGLAPPAEAADGMAILMAASRGQRALDQVPGVTADNGLFTYELVESLKKPGEDVISALRAARDRVETKARQSNHAQRPALVDETRGRFFLFPAAPLAVANPAPPTAPSGPSQGERLAWEAAQRANVRAAYAAYLAEYPNGMFASAAKVAMAATPNTQAQPPAPDPPSGQRTGAAPFEPAASTPPRVVAPLPSPPQSARGSVGQAWAVNVKNPLTGNVLTSGKNVIDRREAGKLYFSLGDVVGTDGAVHALSLKEIVVSAKDASGILAASTPDQRSSGRAKVSVDYKRDKPADGDLSWDRSVATGGVTKISFTLHYASLSSNGGAEYYQRQMKWTSAYAPDSPLPMSIDLFETSFGRVENSLIEYTAASPTTPSRTQAAGNAPSMEPIASGTAPSPSPDCAACPAVVVLPEGRFLMGSSVGEPGRRDSEGPVHEVRLGYRLAVGRTEVTRGEFARFVKATDYKTDAERDVTAKGCAVRSGNKWEYTAGLSWRIPAFDQSDAHPVVCVSWNDAQVYLSWLSNEGGSRYRLLTEAESEYAARGGRASQAYPWGDDPASTEQCAHANGAVSSLRDQRSAASGPVYSGCNDGNVFTAPVAIYKANPYGLYDLHGNVWEWVQDVWHDNYEGAPADGSAWMSGGSQAWRTQRGGSWMEPFIAMRVTARGRSGPSDRFNTTGFRIAKVVKP